MRNTYCPICQQTTEPFLSLRFASKMHLPTQVELSHCGKDNFLFSAGGCQSDYEQYYATVVNDSYHKEVSGGISTSPISKLQKDYLVGALGEFFTTARNVLDFGCGGADLLIELATTFPFSTFYGFDPSPAAQNALDKARTLGLRNLSIGDLEENARLGHYDLVIASHVLEHVLDLKLVRLLRSLVLGDGLLYVEVPSALCYESQQRLEFLYYFDRLHVNHFTPQSLARLLTGDGLGYVKHFEYTFPYRDGAEYPALGMLFRKGGKAVDIKSPSILDGINRYVQQEKEKARKVADLLDTFEGVLVWGAGDNFYRSVGNGGPLQSLHRMVLLDRRPHDVIIGNRRYQTVDPLNTIRSLPWPVVVTISEGRKEISKQVTDIDPDRRIIYI